MVPSLSILCMLVSFIISFGLPISLFFIFKKRYTMRIQPLLFGVVGFILFAMVLEQILHWVVLRPDADGGIALRAKPLIYILYGCFAAGIFEETARFIAFSILKYRNKKAAAIAISNIDTGSASAKKRRDVGEALSYGIGHGGIEAVLLLGFAMISNIVVSIMINMGMSALFENHEQISAGIQQLASMQPYMFLVGGLERIFAVIIQISLSVIVWISVNAKGKKWLYAAAVLLHALIDVPAALMQCGILKSVAVVELIVAVSAVAVVWIAVLTYKKYDIEAEDASE